MAFSRAAAARSFCFRAARPSVVRPQLFRQIARRTYASGGYESAKAGGDAVWAAGSVAVTVPTCWYLLQNAPDTSHGHGDHGDSHGKEHEEEHEEESKDEESKDEGSEDKSEEKPEEKSEEGEDKADGEDSEKSEDSDSGDEDKGTEPPDTSADEGESESEKSSDDKNSRKSVPDAKGGSKVRKESNKAVKAGEVDDEAATSGKDSGKQEGLSNTDTKHSTDITNDRGKSTKGEGVPETAKSKGPVDPKRPQPEAK